MLKSLNIKNYAIIDNINIDFNNGFNAFVGETGGGKSIRVGAISFLLKGRSDSSVIKKGKDKAIIEGVFDIKDESFINKLKDNDIEINDYVIVKRTITQDNKNTIKINDSNVTLNFLQDLFKDYVDIHSQKENNFLFNKKNQLKLLDKYSHNEELLKEYQIKYNEYTKLLDIYNDLLNNTYSEREFEFLTYDLKELEDANISLKEKEELLEDEKIYKSSSKTSESITSIINNYDALDKTLYAIKNSINNLSDIEELKESNEKIDNIYFELKDIIEEYKSYKNKVLNKEIDIDYVESKLYTYSKLERKYKKNTEELIKYIDEIKEKLKFYSNKDEAINNAKDNMEKKKKECEDLALKLRKNRKEPSKIVKENLIKSSFDLNLTNLNFDIQFEDQNLSKDGNDSIEFVVSLNKNEDLKPLKDIASGGETSRLMLLLKEIFSKQNNIDLMIFDEIDTGISGKTALAVGKKINILSKYSQIICISHLASVVACADHHYLIYKKDNKEETNTFIEELNKEDTIKQIAIISSSSDDETAIKAAKELIKLSKE